MNKPIQEIYAIGEKLPPEVLMDIDNRIADWLMSGGNDDDPYVWQQLRYAKNILRSGKCV
jgi:hypothetical protein